MEEIYDTVETSRRSYCGNCNTHGFITIVFVYDTSGKVICVKVVWLLQAYYVFIPSQVAADSFLVCSLILKHNLFSPSILLQQLSL